MFFLGVVYRSIPTSNRNIGTALLHAHLVVYRSIPTSNRNCGITAKLGNKLYIVLFLHQTATLGWVLSPAPGCISFYSYIKPQRSGGGMAQLRRCISFYSYIKPQQQPRGELARQVVYRSIPTSNRNFRRQR